MGIKQQSIRTKSIVYSLWSKVSRRRQAAAFTLVELLVAMGILMVIVLMLANLFQQSTRSWDTGMRQAEVGLEARAAINMIERDLNQAVASSNMPFTASGSTLAFSMLVPDNTNGVAIERVTYTASGGLKRNDAQLLGADTYDRFTVTPLYSGTADPAILPDLVEINLEMSSSRDYSEVRVYVEGRGHDEPNIDITDVIDTRRE